MNYLALFLAFMLIHVLKDGIKNRGGYVATMDVPLLEFLSDVMAHICPVLSVTSRTERLVMSPL